ncbi:MAG: hypothetical protein P1P89_22775, partial [Desulfobacterales bacterium]|nr:hypothetical protein [Desulfobacterales bacterium]
EIFLSLNQVIVKDLAPDPEPTSLCRGFFEPSRQANPPSCHRQGGGVIIDSVEYCLAPNDVVLYFKNTWHYQE